MPSSAPNPSPYALPESAALAETLTKIEQMKAALDHARPYPEDLWNTIQLKLKIEWTYDSNAIEGSTLSRGETAFFLREGLTVEGRPFKDFLDARNHAETIDFLYQVIKTERAISTSLLKEFNALLLSGITHTEAVDPFGQKRRKPATPGAFKRFPNHVLQLDGTIHHYTEPEQVAGEMERLCGWIQSQGKTAHPLHVAAIAHYNMVRVHPFDDGNGRGARLLMNLILIQKGYPPAIIRMADRKKYLETLAQADRGHVEPFIQFIGKSLLATQEMILSDLQKQP